MVKTASNSKIVRQLFFNVIIVVTLSNLVGALTNFTDGICCSRLIDDNASAALAVVGPLVTFVNIITNIIQIGAQILCSRRLAQGDIKTAKKIFSTSIAMCVISGIILMIIAIFTGPYIVRFLGAPNNIILEHGYKYVIGFFVGAPFYIAFTVLLPIANLVNGKKLSTIAIGTVLAVNVLGDIFSGLWLGANSDATFGIGIATSLSYVAGVIVLIFAFAKKTTVLKFSFKSLSLQVAGKITLVGLPAGVKIVFIFLRTSFINIMFSNAPTPQVSEVLFTALSAQNHITPFVESITGGLIAASLSLSSIFYAEEDEESLNELFKLVLKATGVVIILSLVYVACASPLVELYGVGKKAADPEMRNILIEEAEHSLRWDSLATPFVALNASFLAFFQGTRKTNYAYIVTGLQSFALPLASLAMAFYCYDFPGCTWAGISFGFMSYTLVHFLYTLIYALIHHNHYRIDFRNIFLLPKTFGYTQDQYIRVDIHGIADVMGVSEKVLAFCEKQNINNVRKYNIAACAEELTRLIVISGFPTDHKKKHVIEMRLLYKKDNLILRLRDDCSLFNIQERAQRIERADDPAANVAYKLVTHFAKDIKYSNLLKTNNLIITV